MFGLFRNNASLSQAPQGAASQLDPSGAFLGTGRQIGQSGWDMFSQRNPERAAQAAPLLPQGMFSGQNDAMRPMTMPVKDPNEGRWGSAGGMHILPYDPAAGSNIPLSMSDSPQPFVQYGRQANTARYRG